MGRKRHMLTDFFIIMDKKANKSNKFAVCKCCIEGSIYEEAYKNRITNTQRECRRHLNSCQFFIAKYPNETERNNILNPILENNSQKSELTDETTSEIFSTISNESSSSLSDYNLQANLLSHLECQWNTWEQPLLLLSFLLYPEYHDNMFNKQIPNLTFSHLGQWLLYYYKAWFGHELKGILNELQQYREKQYPFRDEDYQQFEKKELHLVAQRIFSICISSASIEQLFSTMDGTIQESENEDTELEETQQSEKNGEISSVNEWQETINDLNSLVEEEEEMILESNHPDDPDDPDEKNEELTEFSFENEHPAIVSNAKWKLETLFDENCLGQPAFINLLKINVNLY
ncbi:382_t:CDS:2 [Cetraspora pellucida]|uniref:382_t:CDS:1 n=1 Tax=Cetraspora pellucida TaxID=1433469 RepID=A0ACA9K289_9GLOM|nr:382_t:CDS:2 [Cetraspora pellucida]